MIDLFVDNNAEIVVRVYVAKDKMENVVAADTRAALMADNPIFTNSTEVEEYKFVFKQPSFKDSVDLSGDAFNYSIADGDVGFNIMAMRYAKMSKLIKSWDLKDSGGNAVPANEENVSKLNPVIASVVSAQLDLAIPSA